jgi:hypothetical protein
VLFLYETAQWMRGCDTADPSSALTTQSTPERMSTSVDLACTESRDEVRHAVADNPTDTQRGTPRCTHSHSGRCGFVIARVYISCSPSATGTMRCS